MDIDFNKIEYGDVGEVRCLFNLEDVVFLGKGIYSFVFWNGVKLMVYVSLFMLLFEVDDWGF